LAFLTKLNRLIGLYLFALKTFLRGGIWLPFIIYGFLQFVVLIFMANYTNPYIYPILSPIANFLLDEKALLLNHYPAIYLLLPYLFQWFKIVVGILFEGLAVGLTVVLVLKVVNSGRFTDLKLNFAKKKWFQLALGWTLITILLWALNRYLPQLFSEFLASSPRRQMMFDLVLKLLTVGLYSIFIYALPALIVYKNSLTAAFKTSFLLFGKNPIFSFFLALLPILLTWPISYLTGSVDIIIDKYSPELVLYLLGLGIFIDFIVNCLLTTAVVKLLLDQSN